MPTTFMDGPAVGAGLALRRAPMYLRVVIDQTDGTIDALDQLDDTPGPSEAIHVYRLAAPASYAHVCYRGKLKRQSGWYAIAHYRHMPEVDGEALRGTDAWREWAQAQPEVAA